DELDIFQRDRLRGWGARGLSPSYAIARASARWRRRVDQLRVDGAQALAPGQLAEVDLLLVELLALRPAAEAAEVVVIDLVDRERARIGVPLLARCLLAEVELGLGIGRDGGKILLGDVTAFHRRAQPAGGDVLALRCGEPARSPASHPIALAA